MMAKALRSLSIEVRKILHYDGLNDINLFFNEFEREVPEEHQFQALQLVLRSMLARWWGTHKESFADWK